MPYVANEELYPEIDTWYQFITEVVAPAMEADAMRTSHPVFQKVGYPEEISHMFDTITLKKVIILLYPRMYIISNVFLFLLSGCFGFENVAQLHWRRAVRPRDAAVPAGP